MPQNVQRDINLYMYILYIICSVAVPLINPSSSDIETACNFNYLYKEKEKYKTFPTFKL